ncbi:MAG: molybdopterin-dependent oxidoreductase, partial [Spirochaetales bacterium]|nr:molybdopterin-dependent oxidoreductase [Candidatus Physcosoma equi]
TILSQIAAEVLQCPLDRIVIHASDTDVSPYHNGSYASGTTFVNGKAVEESARILRKRMIEFASSILGSDEEETVFDGQVFSTPDGKKLTLENLVWESQSGHPGLELEGYYSHSSPTSPPPFQASSVEIELDKVTGEVKVLEYNTALDCGTPINPNLVRIQTEGGALQGIGMALYEDVHYEENGRLKENSFLSYRIPSRLDAPKMNVEFVSSYENQGAFGAKSCGEIVINTPSPAIADAIAAAIGHRFTELPITAEDILMHCDE